jgi:hypothetical protein
MPVSLRKNRSLPLTGTDFFESRTVEDYRLLLNNEETIMFYALSWSVVFSLIALWSLAAWAFYSVTAWTVSSAGVLAGGSKALEGSRLPDLLAPWIPPEIALAFTSMLTALTPAVDSMLGLAPALAGGLAAAVWVVWGVGSVLLIVLGFVVTGFIAALRRRASFLAAPARGPAAAG